MLFVKKVRMYYDEDDVELNFLMKVIVSELIEF